MVEDICQRLQSEASTLDVLPPQVVRLRKVQHLRRCIWTELAAPDDSALSAAAAHRRGGRPAAPGGAGVHSAS